MTASNVFTKDPDAVLDYGVDWSAWLGSGETISTSTWEVASGMTMDSDTLSGGTAIVWLSGGEARPYPYVVTNRITTSGGRTDDRSLYITVTER